MYSVTKCKLIGAREAYFFSWVHLASEEASGSSLSTLQLLRSDGDMSDSFSVAAQSIASYEQNKDAILNSFGEGGGHGYVDVTDQMATRWL
jgi:hypothetical protein